MDKAESLISELTMKREDLEDLQKSVREMEKNCSIIEILEQREERTKALKYAGSEQLSRCQWERRWLMPKGIQMLTTDVILPDQSLSCNCTTSIEYKYHG